MHVPVQNEGVIIVTCENCCQRLRLPRRSNRLLVTCPTCRREFMFQAYPLGLSSALLKPLLVGLAGGLAGFTLGELLYAPNILNGGFLAETIGWAMFFGAGLGALLGSAQGFFQDNRQRLYDGLLGGVLSGLAGGMLAGLIAQLLFSVLRAPYLMNMYSLFRPDSYARQIAIDPLTVLARTAGWGSFGLLLGGALKLREPDLRWRGIAAGALSGALSGLLFDPLCKSLATGGDTLARAVAFTLLGGALGLALFRFQRRPLRWLPYVWKLKTARRLSLRESLSLLLFLLCFMFIIGGLALVVGNLSGAFPTFPFAGFIVSGIGWLLLSVLMRSDR